MKKSILDIREDELLEWIISKKQPKFRLAQIYKGITESFFNSFEAFTNLPADLRGELKTDFFIDNIESCETSKSKDGTIKFLFNFHSGNSVETVLIPSKKKTGYTICISTQNGCKLNCKFCATGKIGFKDNLTRGEILSQLLYSIRATENQISNIVFMGMGEPLDNYDELIPVLEFIINKHKMISRRRITISTAGFTERIISLADSGFKAKLAFSLHAANQSKREYLMPSAKKWSLESIYNSLEYYTRKTDTVITLEYIVFPTFNDNDSDALQLKKLSGRFKFKVNLIPFHSIEFTGFKDEKLLPASRSQLVDFFNKLKKMNLEVFIRDSFGEDIHSACGQLAFSKK